MFQYFLIFVIPFPQSQPGKIYGIPLNAEKLLVFDPKVDSSRPRSSPSKSDGLSGVETGHVATGKLKWLAGLSLGGKARWMFAD